MGFSLGNIGKVLTEPLAPITSGPLSAGKDLLGGSLGDLIPGIGDSRAAEKQNEANIAAADKAMAFSERMSSTAYQRAMADMKAAGLNPMLAFSQGGASTPSGVTPTINSTTKSKFGEYALSAATGISGAATAKQQADTQQAQAASSIKLNSATEKQQEAQTAKAIADAEKTRVETIKARKDIPRAELEEKLSRKATDAIEGIMKNFATSGKETSKRENVLQQFNAGAKWLMSPAKQQNIHQQPLIKGPK